MTSAGIRDVENQSADTDLYSDLLRKAKGDHMLAGRWMAEVSAPPDAFGELSGERCFNAHFLCTL